MKLPSGIRVLIEKKAEAYTINVIEKSFSFICSDTYLTIEVQVRAKQTGRFALSSIQKENVNVAKRLEPRIFVENSIVVVVVDSRTFEDDAIEAEMKNGNQTNYFEYSANISNRI